MGKTARWGIVFALMGVSSVSSGDYAWTPRYKELRVKSGVTLISTSENFNYQSELTGFGLNNQRAQLNDFRFFAEAEFGIADDWAWTLKSSMIRSELTRISDGLLVADGMGMGDTWLGLKWNAQKTGPVVTPELLMKFPTGVVGAPSSTQIVQGEGNFDLALKGHLGFGNMPLLLAISPGLLLRIGGYSSALTLEVAGELQFPRGYFRFYSELQASLSELALPPSTLQNHNLNGTGGSYLKLAASPTFLTAGLRGGLFLNDVVGFDVDFKMSVMGARAPLFLQVGAMGTFRFDFFEQPIERPLKEVPLGEPTPAQ